MNTKPIDKTNKKNIYCAHCKHWKSDSEIKWGHSIQCMKCKNENSVNFNKERNYWNRCKCFEWRDKNE